MNGMNIAAKTKRIKNSIVNKCSDIIWQNSSTILQKDLGYTLPNPRRRHFPTLPVVVFNIDEQWAADLIKVINIAKYKGIAIY